MTRTAAPRARARGTLRSAALGMVVVGAVIVGTFVYRSVSSAEPSFMETLLGIPDLLGSTTEEDGALPDGATVFDDAYTGIARLDPGLRQALREATVDAADDGVDLFVNSGWRSPEYQERLLREAVSEHGSEAEAARWVATSDTSPHVSGKAVDIGPFDATAWLSEHGADYGLCQIYRNEPWHYELRPEADAHGCPPLYDDPTSDPRMRR